MGGTPLLAHSIAAFPEELPMEMLAAIFAAADAQVRAAGASSPAVTPSATRSRSTGSPSWARYTRRIWPKNGAQLGDSLFLTSRSAPG
jgi:hypothetical protein